MILLSFCSFPWWLSWLIPFLLGLGLGYAIWSKYKSKAADLEGNVSSLNSRVSGLEGDLKNCQHNSAELEGEVSIAKGKMREAEEALTAHLASSSGKGASGKGSDKGSGKGSSGKGAGNGASGKGNTGNSSAGIAAGVAASSLASSDSTSSNDSSSDGKSTSGSSSDKSAPKSSGSKSIYRKLAADNLQIIEGIGPKMEEVLKENGINNWSDLAANSQSDLRGILGKYGDKYKIIDVETWQQQAKHAASGDFEGLITMQKSIDGGSAKTLSKSDSKLEKYLIKTGAIKRYKQDDLKAIEGVGPKIAGLLQAAGLNTWREVADTTSEHIKQILDDAGSRYKLADPGTWPKQAGLAADGKFDELKEYQDFLQGGK